MQIFRLLYVVANYLNDGSRYIYLVERDVFFLSVARSICTGLYILCELFANDFAFVTSGVGGLTLAPPD